jgi:hypothetical protein
MRAGGHCGPAAGGAAVNPVEKMRKREGYDTLPAFLRQATFYGFVVPPPELPDPGFAVGVGWFGSAVD